MCLSRQAASMNNNNYYNLEPLSPVQRHALLLKAYSTQYSTGDCWGTVASVTGCASNRVVCPCRGRHGHKWSSKQPWGDLVVTSVSACVVLTSNKHENNNQYHHGKRHTQETHRQLRPAGTPKPLQRRPQTSIGIRVSELRSNLSTASLSLNR